MTIRQLSAIGTSIIGMALLAGFLAPERDNPLRPLDPTDTRVTLANVEDEVARLFDVDEVVHLDLEGLLDETDTVLFDVRTAQEFDLGHLPGAVRVDPGMPTDAFLRAHGDRIRGKTAIFYCTVGLRSSELAARVEANPSRVNSVGQYNLRGGTFRWVVSGHRLVKGDQPGQLHVFDTDWGQLFARALATK